MAKGAKRSIADTFVSVVAETSKLAAGIAKTFRETDREAKAAGKRWSRDINEELRNVHATVSLDAAQARADATRLREEIAARHAHMRVDVDYDHDRIAQLGGSLVANLLPQLQQSMARGGSQAGSAFAEGAAGGMQAGGPLIAAAVLGLGGVAAQASGAIGLIPAAAVGAGAAVGALALAFDGFGDAMKNVKDPEKFAESLGQLAPMAQSVATTIQGLMPVFDRLKFTVSDAFFGPLTSAIEPLVNTYMPMLQGGLSQMAAVMGNALGGLAQFMQTPEMLGMAATMTNNLVSAFSTFSGVLEPVVHAFTEIGVVGSGFLPQIAQAAVQAAQGFSEFISQASASGQLQQWIQGGITAMGQLFEIGKNLLPVFGALAPIGAALMPAFNSLLVAITPGLQALGGVLGNLITAASPLLTFLGEMASTVLSALAPAFNNLLTSLTPVIGQLVGALQPVVQALAPILGQVAMIIGQAMADAATTLVPLIVPLVGVLGEMLSAAVPLIPSIVELAASALPMFTSAAGIVIPIVTEVAKILTELMKVIVPPLNTVIKFLAKTFQETFEGIKTAVGKAWEFIKPIFDRITGAVKSVIDSVKSLPGVGSLFKDGSPDSRGGGGSFAPPATANDYYKGLYGTKTPAGPIYVPTPDVPLPAVSNYVAPPPSTGKKSAGAASTRSADDYAVDTTGLPPGLAPEGGLVPNAVQLNRVLSQQFPELKSIGGWREPDGFNEHSSGEALDIMVGSNKELGDRINQFLLQNGKAFGLQYDLWEQRQWNPDGSTSGMENRGSPTANHMDHVHARVRPGAATPLTAVGGDMPALAGLPEGQADPRLRDAYQRVQDREHGVREAQARYDRVKDKGDKATPREQEQAEYALAKAKREHADAIDDLAKKQEKLNSTSGKSKKGQSRTGDLTQDFGKDLVGGIAQAFGFDGTLFADPTQLGLMKMMSSLSKVQFGPDAGQTGGGSLGAAGGGGVGSMLDSFMPKGLGALRVAKSEDSPVPFMGGLPGAPSGGSLIPGAQFAANALASQGQGPAQQSANDGGQQGGGNDYSINFNGPVGNPSEGMSAATEFNIPRARQGVGQL
ncbi:MAG: phage tail protein [Mycobacterium sp.]